MRIKKTPPLPKNLESMMPKMFDLLIDGVMDSAAAESYQKALEHAKDGLLAARKQRVEAIQQQEILEERIMVLRKAVASLSAMCGKEFDEDDEFGLTDSIRMALKTYVGRLNAAEVKTRIEQIGYKTGSTNLLASVHTILRRLVLKGEVDDTIIGNDGKPTYEWIRKK